MAMDLHIPHLGGIPIIRRFPGLPPEILINYGNIVQETIKGIKPVSKLEAMTPLAKTADANVAMADYTEWWWKNGGMKMAHLHYRGEVYALNEAQWKEFSSKIMMDFSKKLAGAKNVSFNEFSAVANAMNEVM